MKKEFLITGGILAAMFADAAELTKAELQKQLDELKSKPAPQKLSMGAMCYECAARLDRIEYVCPVCQEKTLHGNTKYTSCLSSISSIRLLVEDIRKQGLLVTLDESSYCLKCAKPANKPRLRLTIPLSPDRSKTMEITDISDLKILHAFLKKQDKVKLEQDREEPLKNYIPRLKEILELK